MIFLTACQIPQSPKQQTKISRMILGAAGGHNPSFQLRPLQEITLENGLQILAIRDVSLPRIRLGLLVKVGARQDLESLQGLNNYTVRMLSQGTQNFSQRRFAEAAGQIASELEVEPGGDYTVLSMDTLSSFAEPLLELFNDAIQNPAFKTIEMEKTRQQIIADLSQKKDNPGVVAREEFERFIYRNSPYGFSALGTVKTLRKINKKFILKHYLKYYRPNNSFLAVVGNFDQDFLEKVKIKFGSWKRKDLPKEKEVPLTPASGFEVRVKFKEGLQQTQILLGHSGIPRKHPDYLKARIANEILGGDFVSRLNHRLRVELGLTYGVNSSFEARENAGIFAISTFTKNESVEQLVQEVRKVLKDFIENGINEEELAAAKAQYQGQFPHLIETADGFAQTVMVLKFYGIAPDYLTTVLEKVQDLKVSEVNQAIKGLIHPDDLKVVIYSDKKSLGRQLNSLNPILAPEGE